LGNEEEAREYLKLFCAFVWGNMGSFSLLTDQQDLPNGKVPEPELLKIPCRRIAKNQETAWEFKAYVRHGNLAYKAVFHLTAKGGVEMVDDNPIGEYEQSESEKISTFESPYRFPPQPLSLHAYRSDFQGWEVLSASYKDIAAFEKEAIGWQTRLSRKVTVNLSGASCKMLKDKAAQVWTDGNVEVELEEFDYRTFDAFEAPRGAALTESLGQSFTRYTNIGQSKVSRFTQALRQTIFGQNEFENRLKWIRSGVAEPESPWVAAGYFLLTLVGVLSLLLGSFCLALLWAQRNESLSDPGTHLGFRFLLILVLSSVAFLLAVLLPAFVRTKLTRNEATARFRGQPYSHLSHVLRERGDDDAARKVEAEKMWQEAVESSRSSFGGKLWKIFWWRPYGVMFRYGLSPLRAAGSILAIWLLGWGCVSMLSNNKMLQASLTKVAPAALVEKGQPVMVVPSGTQGVPPLNIACGDAIEPGLYSFELLTPILNLHQESRCEIRSKPAGGNSLKFLDKEWPVPAILTHAVVWEYGEALYMLAGTIITSLALLTFSGIARRWEH